MSRNIISTSLRLTVVASLLAACGPTLNQEAMPTNTNNPSQNQANNVSQTNASGSVSTGTSANASTSTSVNAPVVVRSQTSAEMQAALQTVLADEMAFQDTQTLTTDTGFSTQALEVEQEGEVSATLFTGGRLPLAREARQATRVVARKTLFLEKKSQLEASGALSVNADGTLTIDPAKLRAEVKANHEAWKAKVKTRLEAFTQKFKALREVAQERKAKLVSKAQAVRTSDTETTENADGSITKTTKVEFKNDKTGITRNVTSTRTTMDETLVSAFYTLEATHKNYTRTVERSVEVNAEGERTVKVTAVTTWQDGRKRERSEERLVAADGSATGGGSLTVTRADGTVKTYTYTLGITSTGEVTVNGDDAGTEVTLEGNTESTEVTVVVDENGASTELSVDLEATDTEAVAVNAEVDAEASIS